MHVEIDDSQLQTLLAKVFLERLQIVAADVVRYDAKLDFKPFIAASVQRAIDALSADDGFHAEIAAAMRRGFLGEMERRGAAAGKKVKLETVDLFEKAGGLAARERTE